MIGFIQSQKSLLTWQSLMIVIMNLWEKIKKNILKRRLKEKKVSLIHHNLINFKISNYVKIID